MYPVIRKAEQRQRNNLFERLLGLVGLERGGYSVASATAT